MIRDRSDALHAVQVLALRRAPLFQGIDQGEVTALLPRITAHRYARGDVIATPEDLRTTVVIVLEGTARLCRFSDVGQPYAVDTLGPGDGCGLLFGGAGLQPRSYMLAMAESVAVGRLPAADVLSFLTSHPSRRPCTRSASPRSGSSRPTTGSRSSRCTRPTRAWPICWRAWPPLMGDMWWISNARRSHR